MVLHDQRQVDIVKQIDILARKRDYAADVLGKHVLAFYYQIEIDQLVAERRLVQDLDALAHIATLTRQKKA